MLTYPVTLPVLMVEQFTLKVITLPLLMSDHIIILLVVEVPHLLKGTSLMSTTVPWIITKLSSTEVMSVVEVVDWTSPVKTVKSMIWTFQTTLLNVKVVHSMLKVVTFISMIFNQ